MNPKDEIDNLKQDLKWSEEKINELDDKACGLEKEMSELEHENKALRNSMEESIDALMDIFSLTQNEDIRYQCEATLKNLGYERRKCKNCGKLTDKWGIALFSPCWQPFQRVKRREVFCSDQCRKLYKLKE